MSNIDGKILIDFSSKSHRLGDFLSAYLVLATVLQTGVKRWEMV